MSYLYLKELIVYVNLLDFHENWPDVHIQKFVRPEQNWYISINVQEVATTQIFSIVQLENRFSQEPIGISEKASHALLAYYLPSDTVQFVLRSVVMQRLVIQ